jgi:hypothetical protein
LAVVKSNYGLSIAMLTQVLQQIIGQVIAGSSGECEFDFGFFE